MSEQSFSFVLEGLRYVPREMVVDWDWKYHRGEPADPFSGLASYLYYSTTGADVFAHAQRQFHELNNLFVVMSSIFSKEQFNELPYWDMAEKVMEEHYPGYSTEDEQVYNDVLWALSTFSYSEIGRIYVPASALVLLYATFVQTLYSIVRVYGGKQVSDAISQKAGIEIKNIINSLEILSGTKIKSLRSKSIEEQIFTKARKVRNSFLHGDWKECESIIGKARVKECFICIRVALKQLEEIFRDKKVLEYFDESKPPISL